MYTVICYCDYMKYCRSTVVCFSVTRVGIDRGIVTGENPFFLHPLVSHHNHNRFSPNMAAHELIIPNLADPYDEADVWVRDDSPYWPLWRPERLACELYYRSAYMTTAMIRMAVIMLPPKQWTMPQDWSHPPIGQIMRF